MRWRVVLATLAGLVVVGSALVVGVAAPPRPGDVPLWLALTLAFVVVVVSLYKLGRTPSGESVAAPPWTEDGALVADRPEASPETDRISGTELAGVVEEAAEVARDAAAVEEGVAVVREPLRAALVAALERGGRTEADIDAALAEGTWTDDPVAAAVLDERVAPPERSLRRRLWAWLFPEKALRHRTALAVGAVARAADRALPAVVGQHAPRPVPVPEPTLEGLQRAADGELRAAVDGRASVRDVAADVAGTETGASESDDREAADRRQAVAGEGEE